MLARLIRNFLGGRGAPPGVPANAQAAHEAQALLARIRAALAEQRVEDAERLCDEALAASPERADAHLGLGEVKLARKEYAAATASFRAALRRSQHLGDAHLGLARALFAAGDADAAILSLRQAERLTPDRSDVWNTYGLVQLSLGNLESARINFRRAALLDANQAMSVINLALIEARTGRLGQAVEYLRKATAVEPESGLAWSNLGLALRDIEQLDEAEDALRRAVAIRPNHAATNMNLASVLFDHGRIDEAERLYRRALTLDPKLIEARVGLAEAQLRAGDSAAAAATYEQALVEVPDSPLARTGLGQLQLWRREFAAGWKNYEHRFDTGQIVRQVFPFPRWDGGPLREGRLLVHSEQGIGDMILFASSFADALRIAPGAVIEAPAKLERLFARSFPEAAIRRSAGNAFPEWLSEFPDLNATIPAGSLMTYFRPGEQDFPEHDGYLQADPERQRHWRERLAALGPGLKVGISWRGGFARTGRHARSVPLADWMPILGTAGCSFVSLQYTRDAAADLAMLEERTGIRVAHWPEAIEDYDETAALVSALDLVITVCTAVAHLAGALGEKVWILAPAVPSWRYLGHGETLPWYPSARVFRQTHSADWRDVISAAGGALATIAPVADGGQTPSDRRLTADPAELNRDTAGREVPTPSVPARSQLPVSAQAGGSALEQARLLARDGNYRGAVELLERLGGEHPDAADVQFELGAAYAALGELEYAFDCLEVTLAHAPRHVGALLLVAHLAQAAGQLDRAAQSLERAVELKPASADVLTSLARVRYAQGRFGDARAVALRAIALNPTLLDACSVAGLSAIAEEDYEAGAAVLERCIPLAPSMVTLHLNLANAYLYLGRFDESRERLAWVIAREPNNFVARWDYAHLQLGARDFAQGWTNYEYRLQAHQFGPMTAHRPMWRGEALTDKTLLVLGEQGLGDHIMFASCLREVIARAERCVVLCEARLVALFQRSFPDAVVRSAESVTEDELATVDYEVQAGSLPGYFRRSEASFPRHDGYLRADPERVRFWRARLDELGPGRKIGVSWRGGTAQTRARLRSIPLAEFQPLLELPETALVSLQYGEVAHDLAALDPAFRARIAHFPEAIANYDESAALVAALDLIITVCTSIVHLTGALGRPVWVLAPSVPEWRYCFSGPTLPWYPSARLFRQARGQSWPEVIRAVCRELH